MQDSASEEVTSVIAQICDDVDAYSTSCQLASNRITDSVVPAAERMLERELARRDMMQAFNNNKRRKTAMSEFNEKMYDALKSCTLLPGHPHAIALF